MYLTADPSFVSLSNCLRTENDYRVEQMAVACYIPWSTVLFGKFFLKRTDLNTAKNCVNAMEA